MGDIIWVKYSPMHNWIIVKNKREPLRARGIKNFKVKRLPALLQLKR